MIPNEIAGKYELRGTLGSGAMGTVYDCMDRNIERRVAIKVVKLPPAGDPEGEEAHGRFRREAQAAGRLTHPNIVGVYDYGENAETAWIVMELVEGRSLKDRLDRKERFPVPEIVRIMDQVCAALAYSHGRGVVHRDIKPGNIMLGDDGAGGGTVKMADFGIARLENSSMTQVGTVMGTPSYMAPEQLRGETVDARADIWAAGVMLYQLLTGEKPFEGGFSAVMHKALHTEPSPPSQLSVTAPRAFDAVIARALAKRPEDRFATAAAFAEAIRAAAVAPVPAAVGGFAGAGRVPGLDGDDATMVGSAPLPPPRPATAAVPDVPRKAPVGLIAAGLGAVAAAGLAAFFLFGPGEEGKPAEQQQEQQRQGVLATEEARAEADRTRAEADRRQPQADAARAQQASDEAARAEADHSRRQAEQARAEADQRARDQAQSQATTAATAAQAELERRLREEETRRAERLRADLAAAGAALAAMPCSLIAWSTTATTLTASGIIRRGDEPALRQQLAARGLPPEALRLQLQNFDGPYCRALDLVRPLLGPPEAAPLAAVVGAVPLAKGELLRLDVTAPGWPSQLYVSYLMQSGEVAHLVPSRPEAANARLRLGEPTVGFTGWEVDEPFGTDLVLVFTSERPIFTQRRPVVEKSDDYLGALTTALQALQGQGAKVAVRAMVVETVPRR